MNPQMWKIEFLRKKESISRHNIWKLKNTCIIKISKKDAKEETYYIYRNNDPQKTSQSNNKNQKTMEYYTQSAERK